MFSTSSFYFILLLLSSLSYIYEIYLQPCKKQYVPLYIKLIRFIHHLIVTFYILGFLKYPLVSLILLISIKIHWLINNDKCELTVKVNKYCGYNTNKFITLFHSFLTDYDWLYKYNWLYLINILIGYYITNRKIEYIQLSLLYLIINTIIKK
jgi:hypothetical protein